MWKELGISSGTAIIIIIALYFIIKWAVKNGVKEANAFVNRERMSATISETLKDCLNEQCKIQLNEDCDVEGITSCEIIGEVTGLDETWLSVVYSDNNKEITKIIRISFIDAIELMNK